MLTDAVVEMERLAYFDLKLNFFPQIGKFSFFIFVKKYKFKVGSTDRIYLL